MANDLFHGKFQYAGGHPDLARAGSVWSKPQVRVTPEGLQYEHGKNVQFVIDRDVIKDVQHQTGALSGGGGNDQFVIVEMDRGDRTFKVRFKAIGMTQQKDAFNLVAALNSIL